MEVNHSVSDIAEAWIALQNSEYGSADYISKEWSAQELNMLCLSDCAAAWEVVRFIFETSPNSWVLENLGAGPVETLLSLHEDYALRMISSYVNSNPDFGKVVGHVWRHALSPGVSKKLDQ